MDSSVLWIFWLLILGLLFLIPGYLACRANRGLLHVRKNVIYQPDEKSFWVGLGCFSYLIFGMGLVFMSLVLIIVVLKILVILGMLGECMKRLFHQIFRRAKHILDKMKQRLNSKLSAAYFAA